MTKTQEYLEKKKLKDLNLPKLYVVKSTRDGVNSPVERQCVKIIRKNNLVHTMNGRYFEDKYILDKTDFPFDICIKENGTSAIEEGYGTGQGDLWAWTYKIFLNKDDAHSYYKEELERVTKKYLE